MLIKPVITEKSYRLSAGDKNTPRSFTFFIDKSLNKQQAINLIEKIYKVNCLSSNIINTKGKITNFKRIRGSQSNTKKIIVKLKPGQVIKSFEIEEKKEEKKADK